MKDYSKPNKQFIMIDMYDDSEDCEVQAGVAIPAEHAEAFIAEVERIAVEKFGGATFSELLDCDENDESMDASSEKLFLEEELLRPARPRHRGRRANHEGRPIKHGRAPRGCNPEGLPALQRGPGWRSITRPRS